MTRNVSFSVRLNSHISKFQKQQTSENIRPNVFIYDPIATLFFLSITCVVVVLHSQQKSSIKYLCRPGICRSS